MFFFVKNIAALYLINSELCPLENRDKESKGKALVAEDSRAWLKQAGAELGFTSTKNWGIALMIANC